MGTAQPFSPSSLSTVAGGEPNRVELRGERGKWGGGYGVEEMRVVGEVDGRGSWGR